MTIYDDKLSGLEQEVARLREQLAAYEAKQKTYEESMTLLVQMIEVFKFSGMSLRNEMDLRLVMMSVLQMASRLIPADHAHMFLYDGEDLTLASSRRGGMGFANRTNISWRYHLAREVAQSGQAHTITDIHQNPDYEDARLEGATGGMILSVPLKLEQRVLGVMTFVFKENVTLRPSDLETLDTFGRQVAIVLENAQLHQLSHTLRQQDRDYYEKLNRTKDMLLDTVSHDLKNPIALIKGYLHLLRKQEALQSDLLRNYLSQIEHGTDQMLALITDLLDLAKLETGMGISLSPNALNPLLQSCLANFEVLAREKNIELGFLRLPTNDMLLMDPARMSQVFNNLISNAIKYTLPGGMVILSVEQQAEFIHVVVRDTGLGIPEADIDKLFNKFFRVKTPSHAEIEGTGLGLAIVKEIVVQHQGEIKVSSQLGAGSAFRVILPAIRKKTGLLSPPTAQD